MIRGLKRSSFVLLFAATALVIAGCDEGQTSESADEAAQQEQTDEDHHHDEGEHHEGNHDRGEHHEGEDHEGEHHASEGESKTVEVADDGNEFDPMVSADQIPEGAWHCDMNGEVHYAAMEKGDGECPVCGMDLVQK